MLQCLLLKAEATTILVLPQLVSIYLSSRHALIEYLLSIFLDRGGWSRGQLETILSSALVRCWYRGDRYVVWVESRVELHVLISMCVDIVWRGRLTISDVDFCLKLCRVGKLLRSSIDVLGLLVNLSHAHW